MEITFVPQPTVTGYLITEKIRPLCKAFPPALVSKTTSCRQVFT